MTQEHRRSLSLRSTRKQWTVIIVLAVLVHAAFLLFFKPHFFQVFKKELPPGEEGVDRSPLLNNPFRVLSLSVEPRPAKAATSSETARKSEHAEEASRIEDLGEPQSEMLPLPGGGGGAAPGTRNAVVEPKPLYIPWPKYPAGIRQLPPGRVELMLLINEKGEVEDVKVTRTLPLEELNRIAVDAARKIRFTPGTERGVRKPMWVRLAIGFQPR
jgi:TonB family protein